MTELAGIGLRQLNGDSSWLIEWNGRRILLDPWLAGEDIDLAPWFSRQWLAAGAVANPSLPDIDLIVISHPFADHCSVETLVALPSATAVCAVPPAARKIRAMRHFQKVTELADRRTGGQTQRIAGLDASFLSSRGRFNLTHNAVWLADEDGRSVFYAPHGYTMPPDDSVRALLRDRAPTILLTTFRRYWLPALLGGPVNLGADNARDLAAWLQPTYVMRTHDGRKHEAGLVTRIRQEFIHPDPASLFTAPGPTFRAAD